MVQTVATVLPQKWGRSLEKDYCFTSTLSLSTPIYLNEYLLSLAARCSEIARHLRSKSDKS